MPGIFYNRSSEEALAEVGSSKQGLSGQEAGQRFEKFGPNEIQAKDKRTWFKVFLSQFSSPLIIILILASIIAGFLGERLNAIIIISIIFINTFLGFYQEYKSERALSELKKYISFNAKVLRDGSKIEVNVRELVPGDLVFLSLGDVVPADLRIIESDGLSANESEVTGESLPVQKVSSPLDSEKLPPAQQSNMAFMGTSIVGGTAVGVVVLTGKETEFGRTATVLSAKEPPTDFQKNISRFGDFLVKIIVLLTIFVFISNALLGRGAIDSFLFAIALAVGITPELLPIIITVSLSVGAVHLAKRKVVVKRLVSIEDLGNIDVLCMDKTGTITENVLALKDYFDASGKRSPKVLEYAAVCSSAVALKGVMKGNPIDLAILSNEEVGDSLKKWTRIKEFEFDHERKRMSVVSERVGKRVLICKGAPESVIDICSMDRKNKKELLKKFSDLSLRGLRVLAVAFKEVNAKSYSLKDESGLTFMGLLVFIDPPKKTVQGSIKTLKSLGVDMKVLTGDDPLVTAEVSREVGFEINGEVLLGADLEKMNEKDFADAIEAHNVFARLTPSQKFRIVEALSKKGHVVGFLGDGVNDAPAIKRADVGITVNTAVDVAKDSADIILLRKSLAVLADGIREGRRTFGNIIKYIFNTISANFGNMFTLALSSLFLKFIPLLPAQILLANLISDGPLVTISTDNVDDDYLHKPKKWSIKSIANFMVFFGIISSVFDFVTIGVLVFLVKAGPEVFRTAWFFESVISEIIVTFSIRTKKNFWQSKPSRLLLFSSILAGLVTLALTYPPFAFLFDFRPLPLPLIFGMVMVLAAYFVIIEFAKKKFYAKHDI